ncbi:MAG TPA: antitoxin family protein [Pirellulales bacterium]|nr:antitoxin family protein [Pirellulales bacterium]
MSVTIAATYENGVLKPQQPLELAEGAQVQVTIRAGGGALDPLGDVIGICESGRATGADEHNRYIYPADRS